MTGNTSWPNVRADLVAKRDALVGIIAMIDLHFVDVASPGEMPDSAAEPPAVRRGGRRKGAKTRRATKARTPRGTRTPENESTSDAAILVILRTKGPQSPGELEKRVGVSRYALMKRLHPLIARGAVVATGTTLSRRFSLPGKSPAKEAP